MKVKTYRCNLRGVDVLDYIDHPYVVERWGSTLEALIGKAKILKGKRSVEVEYREQLPNYKHTIGTSIITYGNSGFTSTGGYKAKLIGLAVIPIVEGTS